MLANAKSLFKLENNSQWLDLLIRSVTEPSIGGVELPRFPHPSLQRRFVGSADEAALREAFTFYTYVKSYAAALGMPLHGRTRLLDFGAGWGRFTRIFWNDIDEDCLFGVDTDPDILAVCRGAGAPGVFERIDPNGPLPFEDESFDAIIAYSVFSHLPESVATYWMRELNRVAKPGCVFGYTTEPRRFLDFVAALPDAPESSWHAQLARFKSRTPQLLRDFDAGKFCYLPTSGGEYRSADVYGDAIIPESYIRSAWSEFFTPYAYVDDPKHFWQAFVATQKAISPPKAGKISAPNLEKSALATARERPVVALADPIAYLPNFDLYEVTSTPELWNVNSVTLGEEAATLEGWSLPHGGLLGNSEILLNGVAFEPSRHPPKGLYAELYPWRPNAAYAGWTLQAPYALCDLRSAREVSIASRAKLGQSDAEPGYTLDFLVDDLDFAIPPADIAARIGVADRLQFVMYGRSIYRGLEKALQRNFGKGFVDFGSVLDWGCGSGRVARHVAPALRSDATFLGFDIDALAVDWANANVGPYFRCCDAAPPLDLASNAVDLVYAYSVFTHLSAANLTIWLKELARVLKPGALALFTVLSDRAMISLQHGLPREALDAWRSIGIRDLLGNDQLESIGVSSDYYRNVWLTKPYIERALCESFEMVDYIGCFHFYQDLVIARKRG